jgi:hypothetical protein
VWPQSVWKLLTRCNLSLSSFRSYTGIWNHTHYYKPRKFHLYIKQDSYTFFYQKIQVLFKAQIPVFKDQFFWYIFIQNSRSEENYISECMTVQFSRTFLQIHELSSPWFSLLPFQVFSRISRTCYEPWLKKNSKFGKQGVAVSQVWELLTRYNSSLQSFICCLE